MRITALEYDAYIQLAEMQIKAILEPFFHRVHRIAVYHRIGLCPVGCTAVIIAVSAAHRHEAFKATEHIMEEIKKQVGVWKRDIYTHTESNQDTVSSFHGEWKSNRECIHHREEETQT